MKKEFIDYLEKIGITDALINKVKSPLDFYSKYLGYDIEDIFITEYITNEGIRIYENLWFFNKDYCFESKNFLSQEDFDADKIQGSIQCFCIKKIDFDIINGVYNENSRLKVDFFLPYLRTGDLKASRENCPFLSAIVKKYIQPNFKV